MRRLHGMDAMFLYGETPTVHTHTIKVGVIDTASFDGPFTVEVFRELLWRRLHLLEPLRYRLVNVPLRLHHPVWAENSAVDLSYHVQAVTLAPPGGRRELDRLIGDIAAVALDRNRPLWQMYLVDGVEPDCVAVVVKIHHALADGVASANLLARAMRFTATGAEERDPAPVAPTPTRSGLVAAAMADHARRIGHLPLLIIRTAAGVLRLRRAEETRAVHPQLAGRFSPAPSFFNHPLSAGRRFASATLSLADVKDTARSLGLKINDVVLATAAGGLRELLLRYDGRADRPLVASVPTSLDPDPNRVYGNRAGGLNVSLPVQVDDPLERVRLTALGATIAKEDVNLLGPRLVPSWMEYLPPALTPPLARWLVRRNAQTRLQNLTISNVPGPRERGRMGGVLLREFYSVGPLLPGSALNITVWSYVDQLNISVLTDDETFADPHEVTDAVVRSFTEIRLAAGFSGSLTVVDTAMPAARAIA